MLDKWLCRTVILLKLQTLCSTWAFRRLIPFYQVGMEGRMTSAIYGNLFWAVLILCLCTSLHGSACPSPFYLDNPSSWLKSLLEKLWSHPHTPPPPHTHTTTTDWPRIEFLNPSTIDILYWMVLCCGRLSCTLLECSAATLASSH